MLFEGVIVSSRVITAGSDSRDAVAIAATKLYTVRFEGGEHVEMKREQFKLLPAPDH